MRKAQASVELTVLMSAIMLIFFIIFDFSMNSLIQSNSMLQTSQARNTVDRLAKAVTDVHNEGVGARRSVYIQIPDNVNSSRIVISNNRITIGVYTANGPIDVTAPTDLPVVQGGYFPTTPGSYWVWVISKQSYAQIGTSFTAVPMNEYLELFPSNSTSANITVAGISNSTVNVTADLTWSDSEVNTTINGSSIMNFSLLSGTTNSQLINLTVVANNNASFGFHSGYVSINTSFLDSEVIPVVVDIVGPPSTSASVSYLTIDTYNDSGYTNSSASFLASGPNNVTYYKVKLYNSTNGLANSTITVRVYNTTSAVVSEQTYSSPNNGTGTYLGNYSISNAPVGTWKITTYEIGGVNAVTYFTVS